MAVPRISYPSDLPVSARAAEIAKAIHDHQVVVVCGETGSGKSTQLPKICLDLGRGLDGMIGHTQPRRLAARAVASRLAEETGLVVGRGVGYKVRFGDATGPETLVKVMTDGILLAETQGDPGLEKYDTIIIDEAHERSLNIDFLLGYLKQLLPRRRDLKVVITSATIDPERFSRHFDGAPIINVTGRTYPVEVRYRPLPESDDDRVRDDDELIEGVVRAVDECAQTGPGDVLVFFSGEREIREASEALRKHHPKGTEIVPLYAKLSAEEQQRVFAPHRGRRIVLATNVAETSLTVPGIHFVVDTGLARISRFNPRTKVQRLLVEPVSRASADQRKGRCGRIAPGVCIRLYSEEDFRQRGEFTEPEILRSNLAGVILRMKGLRLGRVENFPFVEAPDSRQVREGYRTLHELGAVTEEGELTPLGERLAKFPIDPRIGRMVLAGAEEGSLHDVLIVASALSVQDPRERPFDKQDLADAAHEKFKDEKSDFLTLINIWKAFHQQEKALSHSRLRRWCKENFLSYLRLREWHDVHRQIREVADQMGLKVGQGTGDADRLHKALLTGLLSNVGQKTDTPEYRGPHGVRFFLFPGSALFAERPLWVMAAELVQTSRLYARTVAPVKPEWIEGAAKHLVKRTYHEPFWEARRGRVNAYEKVSLHGLELVSGREVHYGPIEPRICRDMFIQKALVDGDYRTSAPWARHNRKLIAEVTAMEERLRRRDLLAGPEARYAFFEARVPEDIYTGAAFERWRQHAERSNPEILFMSHDDVLARGPEEAALAQFPEAVQVDGSRLPLRYKFDPGQPDDGVVMTVPLEAVARLDTARLDWAIPGLVREKIVSLVKGLPKSHRRLIGSAGEFAEAFLRASPPTDVPLQDAINEHLRKTMGATVSADVWAHVAVPEHLRIAFRVIDPQGQELARGRDLPALRRELAGQLGGEAGTVAVEEFTRDGVLEWDFGDLPESIELKRRGALFTVYPCLIDRGRTVSIRALDSAEDAAREHEAGTLRLFILAARRDLELAVKGLSELEQLKLLFSTLGSPSDLREDLIRLIAAQAFFGAGPPPRGQGEFASRVSAAVDRIGTARQDVSDLVGGILEQYQAAALELSRKYPPAWEPALGDMRRQLAELVQPGFLQRTPREWLRHLPRFLHAIPVRLRKLAAGGLDKDARHMQDLAPFAAELERARALTANARFPNREVEKFRWMLEELRIWMFAQELRTSIPISLKRMEEQRQRLPRE